MIDTSSLPNISPTFRYKIADLHLPKHKVHVIEYSKY